ncbi:MAG: chemotaxis protein CheB, partial [bacterium]|nr:chemotaxis protein CheB [bacterium]
GRVIAQDEATSVVFGMNRLAIESGCVDRVVPLQEIVPALLECLTRPGRSAGPTRSVKTGNPALSSIRPVANSGLRRTQLISD